MDRAAIFHEADSPFSYSINGKLRVVLRTAHDVKSVTVVAGDPYERVAGEWNCKSFFTKKIALKDNDLWVATIPAPTKRLKYYFIAEGAKESEGERVYYLEDGARDSLPQKGEDAAAAPRTAFTAPFLHPCDEVESPGWAQDSIFYQIFPTRFERGKDLSKKDFDKTPQDSALEWVIPPVAEDAIDESPLSQEKKRALKDLNALVMGRGELLEWPLECEKVGPGDRYGGTLEGVIERLDYLKDLGITGIYLTPINLSPSEHKYDTHDYARVDIDFGDEETVKRLVKGAHSRGIKIVLDGVFNHSGWLWAPWQDVLRNGKESKYASWFWVDDYDITISGNWKEMNNAKSARYYSFAFTDFMPKIKTDGPAGDYIIKVARHWVRDWDIDGLRLDVANEISHKWTSKLHDALVAEKSDFFIIGEAWHCAENFLRGGEWHSVMNYPLTDAILDVLFLAKSEDLRDYSQELEWGVNRALYMYQEQVVRVCLNQLDSHDTARAVTRLGDEDLMRAALAILFTLPGAACIYYGTELLLRGDRDPDCRRPMPWNAIDKGDYKDNIDFMKGLIKIRKDFPDTKSLDLRFIHDERDKNGVIRYKKGDSLEIIINLSNSSIEVTGGAVLSSNKYSGCKLDKRGFVIFNKS